MTQPPITTTSAQQAAATPAPGAIALHRLPVQLRMLVRVMGEAAAFRLVQWRGGVPYTVPKKVRSAQFTHLVEAVGADGAMALHSDCAGVTLQLPKYDGVLRQLQHQRVIELRLAGLKLPEIALATGFTQRWVIKILTAARLTGLDELMQGQGDLFGQADRADPAADSEPAAGLGLPWPPFPAAEKGPTSV